LIQKGEAGEEQASPVALLLVIPEGNLLLPLPLLLSLPLLLLFFLSIPSAARNLLLAREARPFLQPLRQIFPSRVYLLDQCNLLLPRPRLQFILAPYRAVHILKPLKVNQPMNVVVRRMRPLAPQPVLPHPQPKVVGHTNVQISRPAAQDVNEKRILSLCHAEQSIRKGFTNSMVPWVASSFASAVAVAFALALAFLSFHSERSEEPASRARSALHHSSIEVLYCFPAARIAAV
jgi:hypothetical protein